ncbi:MAG: sulfatase-like hydrolase/transferase [Myxococcota bacterium]
MAALACSAPEPPDAPSIVLISIDSLRADRLGCYGAERETSPAIDALAAAGARFEHAVAPTSWTLPSHVTLLTGLPIPSHRVDHPDARIDPARHLLAEHLAGQGYGTAAFVSAPFLQRMYGFDRGFEHYENFQNLRTAAFPPTREVHDQSHLDETGRQVVDAALAWLGARPAEGAPWFLFVHLWDVHYDFAPPAPYDTLFDPDYDGDLDPTRFEHNPAIRRDMPARDLAYLRSLYDGEIRWLDSQLERLFDALRARGASERIIVSLVADHGDEFFEHDQKGHYRDLYEESVRVPWIVHDPARIAPGTVVGGVAGLDDVAPTLLGLAGLPALPEASGRDLSAHLMDGSFVEQSKLLTVHQLAALRGPGWKVRFDRRSGLAVYYDLERDPAEQDPIPARKRAPERLAELKRRLDAETEYGESLDWDGDGSLELDAATRARLEELGYLDADAR